MFSSLILATMLAAGQVQGQAPTNGYPYLRTNPYVNEDYQTNPFGGAGYNQGQCQGQGPFQGSGFFNPNDTKAYGGYGSFGSYGSYGGYGSMGNLGDGTACPTYGSYANRGTYAGYGSYGSYSTCTRPVAVPASPVPAYPTPPAPPPHTQTHPFRAW